MFKYQFNWRVETCKPGRSKGSWRYSVHRNRRREGQFAIEEYRTKDGVWSDKSMELAIFRTEEEAKSFATKHCGEEVTKIKMEQS